MAAPQRVLSLPNARGRAGNGGRLCKVHSRPFLPKQQQRPSTLHPPPTTRHPRGLCLVQTPWSRLLLRDQSSPGGREGGRRGGPSPRGPSQAHQLPLAGLGGLAEVTSAWLRNALGGPAVSVGMWGVPPGLCSLREPCRQPPHGSPGRPWGPRPPRLHP